jgi:hypothetical protein
MDLDEWHAGRIELHPNDVYNLAMRVTNDREYAQNCFNQQVTADMNRRRWQRG